MRSLQGQEDKSLSRGRVPLLMLNVYSVMESNHAIDVHPTTILVFSGREKPLRPRYILEGKASAR